MWWNASHDGLQLQLASAAHGRFADRRAMGASTVFVQDMFEYAWSLQNPCIVQHRLAGRGARDNRNIDRKLQTSGHILEWLVFTSPREQLQDERTVRAVSFILNTLTQNPSKSFEVGRRGMRYERWRSTTHACSKIRVRGSRQADRKPIMASECDNYLASAIAFILRHR